MSRVSTEGCKCSPRQAKWLSKNLFSVCYKKLPLKYYTMLRRLILLVKIEAMPKYIYGKDFHKNIGKTILMPHPTDPKIEPVELKIIRVENKQVTLELVGYNIQKTDNYSKDKNKYLVIK